MRLSFIKPRSKHLFSWEVKVLLIFFVILTMLMVGVYTFMMYRIYTFEDQIVDSKIMEFKLDSERISMEDRIEFIKIEANRAKLIFTNNELMSDSIKNLFDIIPDKITLHKAYLGKSKLVLSGQTPTKELYKFMLLAPLRSIFDRSFTSYYQLQNGWYNFVSTNYMDQPTKGEEP